MPTIKSLTKSDEIALLKEHLAVRPQQDGAVDEVADPTKQRQALLAERNGAVMLVQEPGNQRRSFECHGQRVRIAVSHRLRPSMPLRPPYP